MAVAFDAVGTDSTVNATTNTVDNATLTVGAGANRALLVAIAFNIAEASTTMVWDPAGANQSLTLIADKLQGGGTTHVALYGLVNPVSGNKILRTTWTNATDIVCLCPVSFTGVNQNGGIASFVPTVNNGSSITPTVTVPSNVGDMVVASFITSTSTFNSVSGSQIYIENALPAISGAANRATGAAFVTMTAAMAGTGLWGVVGANLVSATASAGAQIMDSGARFKRTLIYQSIAQPVVFTVAATPYAGWDDTLEWPRPSAPRSMAYSAPFLAQTLGLFQARDNPEDWTNWPDFAPSTRRVPDLFPWSFTGNPIVPFADPTNWPDFIARAKPVVDFRPWSFIPAPAQVFFPYAPWDDFARRKQSPLDTQPLAFVPTVVQAAQQVWYPPNTWPDFAPKARSAIDTNWLAFVSPIPSATVIGDWPDFVRRKPQPLDTQPLSWTGQTIAVQQVWFPYDPWPSLIAKKPVPLNFTPATPFIQAPAQVFFPYGPWDDFARRQRPAIDTQQFAWSTFNPPPTFFLTPDRWPDFIQSRAVPLNFNPLAQVQLAPQVWFPYAPWDDFTRRKPQPLDTQPLIWTGQTITAAQVWFPYDPWPSFIPRKPVPLNYVPLALGLKVIPSWTQWTQWPDRIWRKPQPVDTGPPLAYLQLVRTPWNEMSRWPDFVPIRTKAGLNAALQQFSARFPGTITQATITGILSAFEVNSDIGSITILVRQSGPAASAVVSIQEIGTI